jgi:hypothetical protein
MKPGKIRFPMMIVGTVQRTQAAFLISFFGFVLRIGTPSHHKRLASSFKKARTIFTRATQRITALIQVIWRTSAPTFFDHII